VNVKYCSNTAGAPSLNRRGGRRERPLFRAVAAFLHPAGQPNAQACAIKLIHGQNNAKQGCTSQFREKTLAMASAREIAYSAEPRGFWQQMGLLRPFLSDQRGASLSRSQITTKQACTSHFQKNSPARRLRPPPPLRPLAPPEHGQLR
jgi:hypothetical protein